MWDWKATSQLIMTRRRKNTSLQTSCCDRPFTMTGWDQSIFKMFRSHSASSESLELKEARVEDCLEMAQTSRVRPLSLRLMSQRTSTTQMMT